MTERFTIHLGRFEITVDDTDKAVFTPLGGNGVYDRLNFTAEDREQKIVAAFTMTLRLYETERAEVRALLGIVAKEPL